MAISNLALYLVAGQIIVWTANWFEILPVEWFYLNPILAFEKGQVWRLVTFLFIPPVTWHPVFLAFAWYIFWMISSALEGQWGTFKFNLFIFLGAAFTVLASLVFPYLYYTNYYIALTVFFAFATLYPNFEFLLFFILPVKVKWLALVSLVLLIYAFFMGGWPGRLIISASMANYLLFFWKGSAPVLILPKTAPGPHPKNAGDAGPTVPYLLRLWRYRQVQPRKGIPLPAGQRSVQCLP